MTNYNDLSVEQVSALGRDEALAAWSEAATAAQIWGGREMLLRKIAFTKCFANPVEGSNELKLNQGWLLKADYPFNYKVAKSDEMKAALAQITNAELVKWEPRLSITQWRALSNEQRKLFEPFVTITPGSPNLKLLAPGAPGNKRA